MEPPGNSYQRRTALGLKAINHLAFITPDMSGTIRFYRDLLGLQLHAGIGHDGYRHYFFRLADNSSVAFFSYDGASAMERKFPGNRTDKPLGFDHVSFTVESSSELMTFKSKLEAAGLDVHGPVDHGICWSIYFYDPNNIPLEISWDCVEVLSAPAIVDDEPLAVAAEGAGPQPGHWPEPTEAPAAAKPLKAGNGHAMRKAFLEEGRARVVPELKELMGDTPDGSS